MQHLPQPTPAFTIKKVKILSQLAVPTSSYTDASPKGSVDEGIRDLIDKINAAPGIVTTSSCGGRVSVFLEGRRTIADGAGDDDGEREEVAGVGGKGAGGTWLFVSHDPVQAEDESWIESLQLAEYDAGQDAITGGKEQRLIHFKFEPMILHILTTSPSHAQLLLRCALQAGFRESGALNLLPSPTDAATPIVAIRSMGLSFESLVGYETASGQRRSLISPAYLRVLMSIGSERFVENTKRIERFRDAFRDALTGPPARRSREGGEWEDAETRRKRKRAEGLRRAELARQNGEAETRDTRSLDTELT